MVQMISNKLRPTYHHSLSYPNYSKYTTEELQRMIKSLRGNDKDWCKLEIQSRQNKNGQFKTK